MDREEKFSTSLQAALKLDIALERLLDESGVPGLSKEWEQTYREYLKQRAYPALLRLIGQGDAGRLRRFLRLGLAERGHCRQALEQAGTQNAEIRLLLMGADAPYAGQIPLTEEDAARKAWELAGQSLAQEIPYLHLFFSDLEVDLIPGSLDSGMDGVRIYLGVSHVLWCFREGLLREVYLHMMIHILYGHLPPDPDYPRALWDISCDVAAWRLRRTAFGLPLALKDREKDLDRLMGMFPGSLYLEDPAAVCIYLREDPEKQAEAARILRRLPGDIHDRWYRRNPLSAALVSGEAGGTGEGAGDGSLEYAEYLRRLGEKLAQAKACREEKLRMPAVRRFGLAPGSRRELLELKKQGRYDLRRYLKRFASVREELQTDDESFDYIYYTLGLERYGNMPLIEPLEYMEAHRVGELVIAIDTSGSCSLALVRRFLEETRDMLTRREDFFRKMNVHIIQCDSMIQQHRAIASVEDWKRYEWGLTVEGRGGTDFTPVFRFVEQLRQEGVLKDLKGLLYFTDGDGIYPRQPTDYETAFVFADKSSLEGEQAAQVPGWVVKLCLDTVL